MALTERHWNAIGILGAGAVGLTTLFLFARGKTREALALSVATTLTTTIFAAARVLQSTPEAPKVYTVYPSDLDVGPVEMR